MLAVCMYAIYDSCSASAVINFDPSVKLCNISLLKGRGVTKHENARLFPSSKKTYKLFRWLQRGGLRSVHGRGSQVHPQILHGRTGMEEGHLRQHALRASHLCQQLFVRAKEPTQLE